MRTPKLGILPLLLVTGILTFTATAQQPTPAPPPQPAPTAQEREIADRLNLALQRLPYYGPFDMIGFEVHGTEVILEGWAFQAINRTSAEDAARGIPGVTKVDNQIEVLPVSPSDDRIRWEVFRAIYTDSFLQRYGTPVLGIHGQRWGRRYWGPATRGMGFRPGFGTFRTFPSAQPVGNFAIHIVVQGGRVGLFGTVNSDTDRMRAEQVARGVRGVFDVDNEIRVVRE